MHVAGLDAVGGVDVATDLDLQVVQRCPVPRLEQVNRESRSLCGSGLSMSSRDEAPALTPPMPSKARPPDAGLSSTTLATSSARSSPPGPQSSTPAAAVNTHRFMTSSRTMAHMALMAQSDPFSHPIALHLQRSTRKRSGQAGRGLDSPSTKSAVPRLRHQICDPHVPLDIRRAAPWGHGRHQCCISKNRGDMLCRASLLRGKPWNQDGGHRAQGGPAPWAEDEPNETGVVTLNINIKLREENEHELG